MCTGVAILRSGTLTKWCGLALILMGVLGIPSLLDVSLFQIPPFMLKSEC